MSIFRKRLSAWLQQLGVPHVAMESTGIYWKPVWNLLEGQFELLLFDAQHIKQASGRKSDIRDVTGLQICFSMAFCREVTCPSRNNGICAT